MTDRASLVAFPPSIDPDLIRAWLTARSLSRGLPMPVTDRGGLRVDTGDAVEIVRWVFPTITDGLIDLAHTITAPGCFLKLCVPGPELVALVPDRWQLQPPAWVMTSTAAAPPRPRLPDGYTIEQERTDAGTGIGTGTGVRTHVRILAAGGTCAASGYAVETADAFIYDRIATDAAHRRRGFGTAVMAALAAARTSPDARQVLTATTDGRTLYQRLGWSVLCGYSTVTIPA